MKKTKKKKDILRIFKSFKKPEQILLIVIAVLSFVISMSIFYSSFAFEGATGTSGDCKWTIDTQGKMTIEPQEGQTKCTLEGYEEGKNYSWHNNRLDILSIEVKKGVKANTKSQYLFSGLDNVKSIDLSNLITDPTINSNGSYMFKGLSKLENLNINTFGSGNFYFGFITNDYMFQGIGSALENGTIINIGDSLASWGDAKLHDVFAGSCIKIYKVVNGVVDTSQVYGAPAFNDHISEVWAVKGSEKTCGLAGDCKWTIDTQGKMIIEPSNGDSCTLSTSHNSTKPWHANRLDVLSVEVKPGVSAASDASGLFRELDNVKSIDVSNMDTSMARYKSYMFADLENLENLNLANFVWCSKSYQMNSSECTDNNKDIFRNIGKKTNGIRITLGGKNSDIRQVAFSSLPNYGYYKVLENGEIYFSKRYNLFDMKQNTPPAETITWFCDIAYTAGNTGNEGGNTGSEGGNTGNEGGNTGNEGGNTGSGSNTNSNNVSEFVITREENDGLKRCFIVKDNKGNALKGISINITATESIFSTGKKETAITDDNGKACVTVISDTSSVNEIFEKAEIVIGNNNAETSAIKMIEAKTTKTVTINGNGSSGGTSNTNNNDNNNSNSNSSSSSNNTSSNSASNTTSDDSVVKKNIDATNPYTGDKIIKEIIASTILFICVLDLVVLFKIRKKEKVNL